MGRCENCRKHTYLGMFCKWCECKFCSYCIQGEIHHCKEMHKMVSHNKQLLQEKLFREKTVSERIVKI